LIQAHAKVGREKAIQFSLANEAESEAIIQIERYMAIPGQAPYKIHKNRRKKPKLKWELNLILKNSMKILESGVMPLALLEMKINAWIENK
jgi:uncharacterized protein (DUF885 family)